MKKIIYSIAIIALTLTSCTSDLKDDINDLKDALNESYLISDSVKITHEYSYNSENPISEKFNFSISSPQNQTISQYNGDIYSISINNLLSPGGNNGFELTFGYDIAKNEVLTYNTGYNGRFEFYGYNKYNDYVNMSAYHSQNSLAQDLEIVVNSIDIETGDISISLTFEYTQNYYYSKYDTDGVLTANFDGTLRVIESKPTNNNVLSENNSNF